MSSTNENFKDQTTLKTRVLQFGEGNFLRAFVDAIIHEKSVFREIAIFKSGVTL